MKTFITLSIILAAGTLFANAGETITLDSAIQHAKNNAVDSTEPITSAWEAVLNKTSAQIANTTSGPIHSTGNANFSSLRQSLTLGNMYGGSSLAAMDKVYLKSFSFITRTDNTNQSSGTCVRVKNGAKVVATSSSTIVFDSTESADTYGFASVDFSGDNVVLSVNTAYTFEFVNSSGTAVSIGLGEVNPLFSNNNGYYIDGSNNWHSVVRLAVSAIPEPSAFGLLAGIGALALAGTRRRRKVK